MVRTNRRHTPRMNVSELAYVNLGPDNGGTIVNISEGGLCFQARAPIHKTETIRFWYSYRRRRMQSGSGAGKLEMQATGISRFIEVRSELAWTDETHKKGGLRFTNLSEQAREQIREWICQPELVMAKEMPFTVPPKPSSLTAMQPWTNVARNSLDKLKGVLRRVRLIRLRSGFSGGLMMGILFSGALYFSSHARQLGDSLIRMGEGLGGRPASHTNLAKAQTSTQPKASAVVPQSVMPELMKGWTDANAAEPGTKPVMPEARREPPKTKPTAITVPTSSKAVMEKSVGTGLAIHSATGPDRPNNSNSLDGPTSNSAADRILPLPPAVANAASSSIGGMLPATVPEIESVKSSETAVYVDPSKTGSGVEMTSERYLEIGRFKEKLLADEKTEQLTDLGFPAMIVPRSRLFGKTYQVLAGPYNEDHEAETAHKSLASHGFTPRSYERGKRDFALPRALTAGGKRLPTGYCVVSWESYMPDAIVRIEDERSMGVTVDAKWVKQPVRYTQNAVAYQINRDGSRTLVEIRFSGMQQSLVFGR
jgi:PilZ domain